MTSISKEDRKLLEEKFTIGTIKLIGRKSASDGTEKFLFELSDGKRIESVLIRQEKRKTICISTQVGCAMGCRFCLTGQQGLERDLETYEIVDQVVSIQREIGKEENVRNIVLMGMGEPLMNIERVIKAIRIFLSQEAMGFSGRRITVSTCGIIPGIERLAREGLRIQLAVSLNAPDDRIRNTIMPINRRYPIEALMKAIRAFPLERRRRVTFEYVLIKGVNDHEEDAMNLIRLLRNIPCKVNLIPFNPFDGCMFEPPDEETLIRFHEKINGKGLTATIRKSRGGEIMAACGQLCTGHMKGRN
jgi:23S rRNA (adenine2503-C2)-methyltransferase